MSRQISKERIALIRGLPSKITRILVIKNIVQQLRYGSIYNLTSTFNSIIAEYKISDKISDKLFKLRLKQYLFKLLKETLIEVNRKLKYTCTICKMEKLQTLLLPCRHVCVCERCAVTIDFCNICNCAIMGTVRVFY